MSKYLLVIVGLVMLAGLAYMYFSKSNYQMATVNSEPTVTQNTRQETTTGPSTSEVNTTMTANENTVEYTNSGFVPSTLTVQAGTTVIFVNKSDNPMWVASNPHPAHTDLPGFDELKSAGNGESYSYTFTKLGNWGYHNHLKTTDHGVVVVK